MHRVSFAFRSDPPQWRVSKSYYVRLPDETLPVKVSTDHGRKRLLVLSPFRLPQGDTTTPYEVVCALLAGMTEGEKRQRAAEMRGQA